MKKRAGQANRRIFMGRFHLRRTFRRFVLSSISALAYSATSTGAAILACLFVAPPADAQTPTNPNPTEITATGVTLSSRVNDGFVIWTADDQILCLRRRPIDQIYEIVN
jgi:hypothetical protein